MTAEDRLPVYSKIAKVTLPGRTAKPEGEPCRPAAGGLPRLPPRRRGVHRRTGRDSEGFGRIRRPQARHRNERLQQASRSAVQTADYTEDSATPADGATSADYEGDAPVSHRYRMSSGEHQ